MPSSRGGPVSIASLSQLLESPVDNDRYKFLWDEYKILQEKVDKIGAFKFQIKGLLLALLAGFSGFAANRTLGKLWCLSLVFVAICWVLEQEQDLIQRAILERLDEIELVLTSLPSPSFFTVLGGDETRPRSIRDALARARPKWPEEVRMFNAQMFYSAVAIVILAIVLWVG